MSDKPILFSGPMVRALLAGTKTQTRRALNPQPNMLNGGKPLNDGRGSYSTDDGWKKLRYAKGDRLYVREHWRTDVAWDRRSPSEMTAACFEAGYDRGWGPLQYEADGARVDWEHRYTPGKFRQGMHMPRWASRLTLTVTDVRVERLQDINAVDALAEGVSSTEHWRPKDVEGKPFEDKWWDDFTFWSEYPQLAYRELWEAINGPGSWEANPWVAAYTFTVQMGNIDSIGG